MDRDPGDRVALRILEVGPTRSGQLLCSEAISVL
jgi:hypothetical protein